MNILLTILMWWAIFTVSAWVIILAMVIYDRIKYGPLQVYYDDDEDH